MAVPNEPRWEKFARDNPKYYILTDPDVDYETPAGRDHFFASGEKFTQESLSVVQDQLSSHSQALDIGCGLGRLTFPHAKRFDRVTGVDIAPSMLRGLEKNAQEFGLSNTRVFLPNEPWDEPDTYGYAYSFIVFQHIESWSTIQQYVHRAGSSLTRDGIAQFQFDSRPSNVLYSCRNLAPDALLPRSQRRGIRRIRRSVEDLRTLFADAGLRVLSENDIGTHVSTFVLARRS